MGLLLEIPQIVCSIRRKNTKSQRRKYDQLGEKIYKDEEENMIIKKLGLYSILNRICQLLKLVGHLTKLKVIMWIY